MTSEIKVAIVGSRNFTDYIQFKEIVDNYISEIGDVDMIISGGCSGVDSMAEKYADEHHIAIKIFPANWTKYGKRAGPIRNTEIVNDCTHLLALPSKSSVGTKDSINKAKHLKKSVKIVEV